MVLKPRKSNEVSTLNFITELWDETEQNQIRGIIETSAEIEDILQNICNTKAIELSKAINALGTSVIFLIVYAISTFFYF